MKRIVTVLLLILMCTSLLSGCIASVAEPEIKSGEFNFSVTYELQGEIHTVSGVYVCKYEGVEWVIDGGFHREWSGYIKGGEMEDNILIGKSANGGDIDLKLALEPDYFMGDSYYAIPEPMIIVTVSDDEGFYFQNDPDVVAATYGAKIISYEYDQPIKNSFN